MMCWKVKVLVLQSCLFATPWTVVHQTLLSMEFSRQKYFCWALNHCSDCNHEIKKSLLLERKAMINLDSVLIIRDITLLTKVCIVKAMVFPVVMYGCESCTIKKTECQRIDAFKLWCWRRVLKVPWTARTSNQSFLK